MAMRPVEVSVKTQEQVFELRNAFQGIIEEVGFKEAQGSELVRGVNELASNMLYNRAANAKISCRKIHENGFEGVEILALEEGLRTFDLTKQGFSYLQGMADECVIHSDSKESRLKVRKYLPGSESGASGFNVSVVMKAHPQMVVCGDGYVISRTTGSSTLLAVIDGLGHGASARSASSIVEIYMRENPNKPLEEMPAELHEALHYSRGAVVGIAKIEESKRKISFVGVGNISGRLWQSEGKAWTRMVSMSGTLGVSLRTSRVISYPWNKGNILIMHSDGIRDRWELESRDMESAPLEMAGHLMREHRREDDDATVMVVK